MATTLLSLSITNGDNGLARVPNRHCHAILMATMVLFNGDTLLEIAIQTRWQVGAIIINIVIVVIIVIVGIIANGDHQ